MNAKQLFEHLTLLEKEGNDLSQIEVNFRNDYDSDVVPLRYINEDLFDESNNKLVSICLMYREDEGEEDTIESLSDQYQEWVISNNFPHISADELLSEETIKKTDEQIKYLKTFLNKWEQVDL